MTDILNKIVAVKHDEVAAAKNRKPLEVVRADAESRVLTRDFVGALRANDQLGLAYVHAKKRDFILHGITSSHRIRCAGAGRLLT